MTYRKSLKNRQTTDCAAPHDAESAALDPEKVIADLGLTGFVADSYRLGVAQPNATLEDCVIAAIERPKLIGALRDLIAAVEAEANEKGAGGFLLARLTDARAVLTKAEQR